MTVAIVKSKYTNVQSNLEKAFDLLGYRPRKEKLFLKPNVASPHGSVKGGDYIRVSLVEALARIFKDRQIIVGEGVASGMDFAESMRAYRYDRLPRRFRNVKLVDLEREDRVPVQWKHGTLELPKIAFDCEYLNIAKMKTHYSAVVSMLLKNQKGLLRVKDKKRFHRLGVQEAICDLSQVLKPDFNILDGIVAMEGNGPNSTFPIAGRVRKLGLLLCGKDILEVENAALQVMRIDPKIAGVPEVATRIVGEKHSSVSTPFKLPDIGGWFRLMNFNMQIQPCCSGCLEAMNGYAKLAMKPRSLPDNLRNTAAFLEYGLLKPFYLFMGSQSRMPDCRDAKLVCAGNCTRAFAQEHGLPHIEGCPPKPENLAKMMWSKKRLAPLVLTREDKATIRSGAKPAKP